MNFIKVTLINDEEILVNLDNILSVEMDPARHNVVCLCSEASTFRVKNQFDDILSTIETMQRRNGR